MLSETEVGVVVAYNVERPVQEAVVPSYVSVPEPRCSVALEPSPVVYRGVSTMLPIGLPLGYLSPVIPGK